MSTPKLATGGDGATPVAREGARAHARKLSHEHLDCLGGTLFPQSRSTRYSHTEACDRLTAAIEARDASAVEVERVYREALERIGATKMEPTVRAPEDMGGDSDYEPMCVHCEMWVEYCTCHGKDARAALARVASLRGGTGR